MTRAALFFIALAVSSAAAAQEPPALPLPADAAKKEQPKKKDKAAPALPLPGAPEAKDSSKKQAAPAPLVLPGLDAAPARSADKKALPPLTLPGADPAKAAPAPAAAAQKPPAPATTTPPPAATAQKAAPATAPATAPRATPASDRSGGVKTLTAQGEKPASGPAATPLGSSIVQVPGDLRLRPDFNSNLWSIRGLVGAERSTEAAYTEPVSHSRLGVEATRWFSGTWLARGELDWRNSRQPYVPLHANGTTARTVMVDENRFDVAAGVGYDFGPRLVPNGRFELTPTIGIHYLGVRNDAFPSDLIGPEIGGRARFALSTSVIAHATLGYTYNLSVAATQNSALKSPVGDFNARAGLALPLSGGYALELDYSGDVLGFQNTYRVAHGAALAFGTSF